MKEAVFFIHSKMAKSGENRMNLAALQRVDSDITGIIDNASQVALYKFSPKANEWEKTDIEGTFFIYVRSQSPYHGFIIMNRLNTTNLMESITEELDFQSQTPFLLYRNGKGSIYGIWFYEKEECSRVGQLMNSIRAGQRFPGDIKLEENLHTGSSQMNNVAQQGKKMNQRQRCASESDSRKFKENRSGKSVVKDDIISLLSRAQDEYDKKATYGTSTAEHKNEPKKVVQNIAARKQDNSVIKPTPVRANGKTATPLSVDSLFAHASSCCQEVYLLGNVTNSREPQLRARSLSSGSFDSKAKDNSGTILHRLLSNPANTVEHIEKLQRNETNKTSEICTSVQTVNGTDKLHSSSVESLEQDLKKKLNLISPLDNSRKHCTSPNLTAAVNTKSPATIIEESSYLLLTGNQLGTTAGLSSKETIHPILTPAAFENCAPLNKFNDHLDCSLGGIDNLTSNDTFKAAAKSLKLTPENQASEPLTLISPMVFAMTNNNINGTIKPSPVAEKMLPDASPTDNSQPETSHDISDTSSSGLLLPQHLMNGVAPAVNKYRASKPGVTPLTKDQLKEALLYMLQNDADFLSKIHESYVNSLRTHLNSTKS